MPKKILIIAGEASGDLYGGELVSAIKKRLPDAEFSGVGSSRMKAAGVRILHSIDDIAIVGVIEILTKLRIIKRLFSDLTKKISEEGFDLAILVNYPGFNLRLARILKRHGVRVVFYSSPQVWAWGQWRIKTIKRFVDKMIVFFKFEEELYKKNDVNAEYVGHPMVDEIRPKNDLNINEGNKKIISLVPGSRKNEIKTLFNISLDAAKILYEEDKNRLFLVTKHSDIPLETYKAYTDHYNIPVRIVEDRLHDCLRASDVSIVVSGSVTLEAAILNAPMVIIYRVAFISEMLFRLFAKIKHIGLVNIVAGKRIIPEFKQGDCTPKKIAQGVSEILRNKETYTRMKQDLGSTARLLGSSGASSRAAEIITKEL